jgi:hypothetical protein
VYWASAKGFVLTQLPLKSIRVFGLLIQPWPPLEKLNQRPCGSKNRLPGASKPHLSCDNVICFFYIHPRRQTGSQPATLSQAIKNSTLSDPGKVTLGGVFIH